MTNYFEVDYSDLQMVKKFAIRLSKAGSHMTVILRPGAVNYNIIHTNREKELLKDAMVVYRTGEHHHE